MVLQILAYALMALWLLLVVLGKGGFTHVLLLIGVVIWIIDAASIYRSRMKVR